MKGELLEALAADGLAVLDAGDPATPGLARRAPAPVSCSVAVGPRADADVRAVGVALDAELRPRSGSSRRGGAVRVALAVRGAHQVVQRTLAAAVALAHGVPFDDVAAGLATVRAARRAHGAGAHAPTACVVLDDAYNANPASMAAALEALAGVDVAGRRIAVLGEMLELGDAQRRRARRGRRPRRRRRRSTLLVAVGPRTRHRSPPRARAAGVAVTEVPDAAAALDAAARGCVAAGDAVLVKGSRAVGLERRRRRALRSGDPAEDAA